MAKFWMPNPYHVLCAISVIIVQVQAGKQVYTHSRSHQHEWSSWDSQMPLMKPLHNQGAAADSRTSRIMGTRSYVQIFTRQSRQESSPAGTMANRRAAAVSFRRASRRRQQIDALISFKANVSNSGTTFRNWDANESTPCGWTGISCSPNFRHVLALKLPSRRLAGNINFALLALSRLESLTELDLSDNNFTSVIRGSSLLNFSSLAFLNLSFNQVEGDIPKEIGKVSSLQQLLLAGNSLTGPIPPSICNCTILKTLDLESNLLVSQIPETIGRLSLLEELVLGTYVPDIFRLLPFPRNKIVGPLPSSLGNCSSLLVLSLNNNPTLRGQIPDKLGELLSLQGLNLFSCNLQGILPRWIGNLTSLVDLSLGLNQLHGSIPAEIGLLSNLSGLSLEKNFFMGKFPPDIANCTSLVDLDVGDNSISGIIPSGLRDCRSLRFFSFQENPMYPELFPAWITSLTDLEYLHLPNTNLHGEVPLEIGRLSKLQELVLSNNSLTGSIPSSLSNCTYLTFLLLDNNNLTGRIPPDIGLLSNLLFFTLEHNTLIGSIPYSITNMTQLLTLDVESNALGGTIDIPWGRMSELRALGISQNQFVGSIPKSLSYCSNLKYLEVSENQLTGEIPATLGNISQLQVLYVGYNRIRGNFPLSLGNCSFLFNLGLSANNLDGPFPDIHSLPLLYLYMNDNKFTGTITHSLENLTELVELDLSQNRFSGNVPRETLSKLTKLTYINLSHNFLSGSLSADWSSLLEIQGIDVSSNNISKSIPNLSKLKSLQSLDVSRNNFSGNLPQWLASLPALVFFNASYNNFEGPIPSSRAFDSNFTTASFLGNPGLCGGILGPSRGCQTNPSQSHLGGQCERLRCARVWIPTVVAGVTFLFLAAAAAVLIWWMRSRAAKQTEVFGIVEIFHGKYLQLLPGHILAVIGDEGNRIGSGSQSVVYKGSIPGWGVVAIKTFVSHNDDGLHSNAPNLWRSVVEKEARIQGSLRHRNILKALCFCSNLEFRAIIVLEYLPRGSLENHLYLNSPQPVLLKSDSGGESSHHHCELPWEARFCIAVDVAEGMKYLHHDCQEPLIHGDLKPSNVLLDDDMVAKVADFGISKFINLNRQGELGEATVSNICGTVGYMPPEYAFATFVSTKGDVFSYGILVLEMLSRRSPQNGPSDAHYGERYLQCFHDSPLELLDPVLQQEGGTDAIKSKQMLLLAKVAFFCTRENPQSRPSMKDVLTMLTQIQELGLQKATRKTVNELLAAEDEELQAHAKDGINAWENEDPNAAVRPSISN